MLEQLRTRFETTGVKPAVICVSSIAAHMTFGIYSATKVYVSNLMKSLSYTSSYFADFLAYEPAEVKTKMITAHTPEDNALRIQPEEAAEVCFRDLGTARGTIGHRKHYQVLSMINMFPEWLFQKMMKDGIKKMKEKMKEQQEKDDNFTAM